MRPALRVAVLLLLALPASGQAAQRPDLQVPKLTDPPAQLAAGASATVKVTVANKGSKKAAKSSVVLLLSRDQRRDAKDIKLGAVSAKALSARRTSAALSAKLTLPRSVAAGRWYLLACADAAGKVKERSEANNCRVAKRAITVAAAGLGGAGGGAGGALVPGSPLDGGANPGTDPGAGPPAPGPGTGPTPPAPPGPTGPPEVRPLGAATPMPAGAVPMLKDSSAFIYSGASPSQRGVAAGTISDKRVAVLRGRVLDELGAPLPGAKVEVLDHPEFGFTVSRTDGHYDLVVNGGALTLNVSLDGRLPVQVKVDAPWRDYEVVPDAILTKLSPKVTTVDPDSTTPLQVVTGAPPPGGGKPSTLLVPTGTNPTMKLPDGTTKPLDDLKVRITEFSADPKALPGPMPGNVAPTYAAEFSVDQAITAGATRVDFAKPLVDYTPNLVGAPVGSHVPTAWYDKDKAAWIPSKDGRVIKITGISGGKAQLDTGTETLAQLGIDDAELTRLAQLYTPGQELWRVLIDHFTPWDHNFPYGPPPGAKNPPLKDFVWKDPNDPCQRKGSTIACESQTLGEEIPVTGTPIQLHYGSNRVPGYTAGRKLQVPVTTGALPPGLHGVALSLNVAGRSLVKKWCDPASGYTGTSTCKGFDPITPNLSYAFDWDGKDAYGRTVQGRPIATVTVTYVYDFFYYESDKDFTESFGQMPEGGMTARNGGAYCANQQPWPFGGSGAFIDPGAIDAWAEQVRQQHFYCGILVTESTQRALGAWDATAVDGLGGLTISNHHAYDPQEHVVHKGDGSSVRAEPLGAVLRDVAGTNRDTRPSATPIDADDADLDSVTDVALGPDGSIYGVSTGNQESVWRVGNDGQLRRIAGRDCDPFEPEAGQPECPEEGMPPAGEQTAQGGILGGGVRAMTVGPDGSVYLLVTGANTQTNNYGNLNGFLRRISPDGKIRTIAGREWKSGSGVTVPIGDNGPASDAAFDDPRALARGADGSFYISERGQYTGGKSRVRKISPKGTVTTIAGGGTDNPADDQDLGSGELATAQDIGMIYSIAPTADGEIYLADPNGRRVQKIARDGILTRVVGGPAGDIAYGENAQTSAIGNPIRIAIGPRGEIYVRSDDNSGSGSPSRIMRLAPDNTILPVLGARNGSSSNSLNDDGEPANGAIIYSSGASPVIVQPDGQILFNDGREEVRRVEAPLPEADADGSIIPSPDGGEAWVFDAIGRHQRTVDALNGKTLWTFAYENGRLSTETDADGNVVRIERTAGGTATAIVAPGGQRTTLGQDAAGRVNRVANPLGEATSMVYGSTGLLSSFTQPGARTSTYQYNGDGLLTKATSPSGGVQIFARAETIDSTKVTATSGEGRATTYIAEALPDGTRQRKVIKPNGATTTLKVLSGGEREVTTPDGTKTLQVFGRDPRWGAAVPLVTDETTTTPSGKSVHLVQHQSVTLSDPAKPFSVTNQFMSVERDEGSGFGPTTTTEYDADQKEVRTRTPEGRDSVTTLDDRGRVVSVDSDGFGDRDPAEVTYDARGLVSRVDQGAQHRTYTYDAAGRLASQTDASGQAITYTYDGADRVKTRTLPGGHVYRYAYAADGTLASLTLPGGQVYTTTVDAEGRVSALRPPAPAGAAYGRTYDLDGAVSLITLPTGAKRDPLMNAGGLLASTEFGAERDAYTYPAAQGRPSSLSRTRDADTSTQKIDLAYDGLLPKETTFSGTAVGSYAFTADANMRLGQSKLTAGADSVTDAYTYDEDGLTTKAGPLTLTRDSENGAVTKIADGTATADYTYDGLGRLQERALTIGGAVRYRVRLTREGPTGRIGRRAETVGTATSTLDYGYDGRGELTSVKEGTTTREAHTYDGNGNRTSESAAYDAADRLTTRGGTAYVFDADGFLKSRGTDTFTYASSGDLLSATVGATTVTYGYDSLNRRTWRKQGAQLTTYLYGDPGNVLRVTASRGPDGVLSVYGYDDEGALLTIRRGATTFYVGADQVGSPAVVLSAAGAVVGRFPRDAYGRPTSGGTAAPFDLPIGFAGGLADPVTGLVRFGLRDYEPASGRFTARDPAMFAGSPGNVFAYAGSDPVGHADPSGLTCVGGGGFAVVGGSIQVCLDDKGEASICGEAGVGVGGGVEIDPFGSSAKTGVAVVAELTGKFGPGVATIGGDLDLDCLNARGYVKGGLAFGGAQVGIDTNGEVMTPTFGGSDRSDVNGRGERHSDGSWGVKGEGKITIRGCKQF